MTSVLERPAARELTGTIESGTARFQVVGAPAEPRQGRWWWPSEEARLPAVLIAAILVVYAVNISGFPQVTDDEGTYLAQAWASAKGLGLAHYTYWYDHPPLGWLQLAAVSWLPMALDPGALSVVAGRYVMLPVLAVSLSLVYVIARRLGFSRWAAALSLVLFGLSPLSVTLNRQVYLDSFAVMWMLIALAFTLSRRRHLWHHVAAGAAASVAVLSKETMLLVVPAVILALWQNTRKGIRSYSFVGFSAGLVLTGIFYPLYAMLKGEFLPGSDHVSLLGAWQFQLAGRSGSGSLLAAESGSAALLQSWLFYDAVLPVAGAVAAVLAFAVRRLRVPALAATMLVAVALRPNGYLPAMYVIQALPFLALALAGLVEVIVARVRAVGPTAGVAQRQARAVLLVALIVLAVAFVAPRWYDGNMRALTSNDNQRYLAAAQWLRQRAEVQPSARVVLDDALWLDAVRAGFDRERVIWFYKLDLDPAVMATLPAGWRDVDYVVSSPALRAETDALPTVSALLTHSYVVASFGTAEDRIEIRQVDREAP